ncbi:interleukin-9 receptor-like [Papio anubis]|uniref:interleukin-9 receptor-like n=1 Tax=Papio anubis TaxID=9555 RepID=UPI0012AD3353|nr:interleukin-9 receptor-like [Papio anubis]
MGAHRAGVLLSRDCAAGTPRGASEPCVQEATALLTCGPSGPWKSVVLEEEQEGTGTSLPGNLSSENVLPAGCAEWRAQLLAYLPQEDWAPTSPTRPAPPDSEGNSNSSDYCALSCYRGCHPSALPGNMQSPGPIPALACSLFCDHQGLETQQGGAWVLAGHCQRPGLHEDLQGTLLPSVLSKALSWTF